MSETIISNDASSADQIFDLIRSRRTCYQFMDKSEYPLDSAQLEKCLQAAIYAPNHKLTQPWRFWVLGEQYKTKLAHIYADNRAIKKNTPEDDCYQCFYDLAIEKFAKIPTVILVGQQKSANPVTSKEDYAACSCAIQNFQLMAWQQHIGVQWSTGPIINDARTFDILGIDANEIELIGALYVGNIDANCQPNNNLKRKSVEEVTVFTD